LGSSYIIYNKYKLKKLRTRLHSLLLLRLINIVSYESGIGEIPMLYRKWEFKLAVRGAASNTIARAVPARPLTALTPSAAAAARAQSLRYCEPRTFGMSSATQGGRSSRGIAARPWKTPMTIRMAKGPAFCSVKTFLIHE